MSSVCFDHETPTMARKRGCPMPRMNPMPKAAVSVTSLLEETAMALWGATKALVKEGEVRRDDLQTVTLISVETLHTPGVGSATLYLAGTFCTVSSVSSMPPWFW